MDVSGQVLPEIDRSKGNANCRESGSLLGWAHVWAAVGLVECCGILTAVPFLVIHAECAVGRTLCVRL